MARLVLVAAVLAGCYSPGVRDCAYTCTTDTDCPDGTMCGANLCRLAGATGACNAGTPDGNAGPSTTNYTLADLDGVPAGSVTFATGTLDINAITQSFRKTITSGGVQMDLVHLATMSVPAGAVVTMVGPFPVIFAVDGDVHVDGTLEIASGLRHCSTSSGKADSGCSSGGAGGAFGTDGGAGGACAGAPATLPVGEPPTMLAPLVGGCEGGESGTSDGTEGVGGIGGGVFEISARGTITTAGAIEAGGGGGAAGGQPAPGGGGGGGGGAGGGILLEAPMIANLGSICAGGGGGGGAQFSDGGPLDGSPGKPGCPAGMSGNAGGGSALDGGAGGAGSTSASPGGLGQASPSALDCGGGGGGGGAGVIVLHSPNASLPGTVFPPPIVQTNP